MPLRDVPSWSRLETLSEGILSVYAKQASTKSEASAAVPVEVVEEIATSSDKGIPEPELVDQDARAQSGAHGFFEERWQVNTGHPDYRANSSRPALKLRYLAMSVHRKRSCCARLKIRGSRSTLEQMVEVGCLRNDRQLTEKPFPRCPVAEETLNIRGSACYG